MSALKKPLTLSEQIDLLKSRGLVIQDESRAKDILSRLNYYRLINAYSLGLRVPGKDGRPTDQYRPGISLDYIYNIYEFDVKLRHIVFELIEYFEVQFRSAFSYFIGNRCCATAYLRPELYNNSDYFEEFLSDLEREKRAQQTSPIVFHHNQVYNGNFPVWVMVEVVSFGVLSKLYKNLKTEYKRDIAKLYRTHYTLLESWLNSFVLVRNICAHYGRLYDRKLTSRPKMEKKSYPLDSSRVFAVIYLLYRYIDDPLLKLSSYYRLKNAVVTHAVELEKVGMPPDWEALLRAEIGLSEEDIATFEE